MPPALAPAQLELLRHCFQYSDSSTHHRDKLSVAEIQDLAQCGHTIVSRKRKLWERTGDVEKLCGHVSWSLYSGSADAPDHHDAYTTVPSRCLEIINCQ